jgi:hypothetical protein
MAGNYAALRARLLESDLSGLSDAAAASALAAPVSVPVAGRYLLQAGILSVLGYSAGVTAIEGIKAASALVPSMHLSYVIETLQGIGAKEGVDFGSAEVQGMLDVLRDAGALTSEAVTALKAYGSDVVTLAETITGWGVPASAADVARARAL